MSDRPVIIAVYREMDGGAALEIHRPKGEPLELWLLDPFGARHKIGDPAEAVTAIQRGMMEKPR